MTQDSRQGRSGVKLTYRVVWRREGAHALSTRIYETWSAAYRKYRRIASIEAVRKEGGFEGTHLEDLPPLVDLRLEQRRVEPWETAPVAADPTEYDIRGAESYADRLRAERDTYNGQGEAAFF